MIDTPGRTLVVAFAAVDSAAIDLMLFNALVNAHVIIDIEEGAFR